jgi:serine/threonine-protein kinase
MQIANRYELGESIGMGGMGTVYAGQDTLTGEAVAIKMLRSEVVQTNPEILERFLREGEALRQLNHPNIVKVLGAVQENDQHYLIMELVSGGSLKDLLIEQPVLPIKRILAIGLEVADALTRAHHLNIIHRDIKPANVLLGEDGTSRLTDFGIARIAGSTITQTGMVVGSIP